MIRALLRDSYTVGDNTYRVTLESAEEAEVYAENSRGWLVVYDEEEPNTAELRLRLTLVPES